MRSTTSRPATAPGRRSLLALLITGALAIAAAPAETAGRDATRGQRYAVLPSGGAVLQAEPGFGKAQRGRVAHGTRLTVLNAPRGSAWFQVRSPDGQSGWMRRSQATDPRALSGGGRLGSLGRGQARGPARAAGARAAGTTRRENMASGRGLDGAEPGVAETTPEVRRAHARVQAIESSSPGWQRVQRFARRGGLGRPGR